MFFAELCTVIHFNASKSSRLMSRPGKVGSYKQSNIQQIARIYWKNLLELYTLDLLDI
jgi:hypothetical protein